ncbi:hypothetical protein [Colwellia piezophila]|uniref:hypothetical protein n=1 Tax=Colwellia piezophila TaxID=211668 RepID=UPI00036D9976|nr:hypothetical protein [Colwellia piezophila]
MSAGQKLFRELGIRQGSYIKASLIPEDIRNTWIDSRTQANFRDVNKKTKIVESSLLVVTSQDCDIACSNDDLDTTVELAIFKPIKNKQVFAGNQFVKSVRKLQIQLEGEWFEAKVEYIITISKSSLYELLNTNPEVFLLPDVYRKSIPLWRANRYLRTALPDAFNNALIPILNDLLSELESISRKEINGSYIRSLYIWLDTLEEVEQYNFEFFALTTEDTPDDTLSEIQDSIENITLELVERAGYRESDDSIYAGRDSATFVSYLTRFVSINLDYVSLAKNDDDTGPQL